MTKKSAGILFYRINQGLPEFLLVHPGGPFWAGKDSGAWSIPKGELEEKEHELAAAIREAEEELGVKVSGELVRLFPVRQKGGKIISAWAVQQEVDPQRITSEHFEMEWPPKSGQKKAFPEVDRAAWFSLEDAKEKINPAQIALIEDLLSKLP